MRACVCALGSELGLLLGSYFFFAFSLAWLLLLLLLLLFIVAVAAVIDVVVDVDAILWHSLLYAPILLLWLQCSLGSQIDSNSKVTSEADTNYCDETHGSKG